MALMVSPFTRTRFLVSDENVEARIEAGYVLVDGYETPDDGDEPESECRDDGEEGETPDSDWTVAEIREWARSHGVELPSGARKADLLEALR